MMGLTPGQAACLAAIKRLTRDGMPPSFEELQRALGLRSKASVHRLVHGLRSRGAIDFAPERGRSIRVLDDFEGIEHHTTEHLTAMRDRIDEILKGRGH